MRAGKARGVLEPIRLRIPLMKGEAPPPGRGVLLGNADSSVEAECELRRREVEGYEA